MLLHVSTALSLIFSFVRCYPISYVLGMNLSIEREKQLMQLLSLLSLLSMGAYT